MAVKPFNLIWDGQGEKKFETGVDRGVLYPIVNGLYPKGVAWNGFTTVSESPDGGDAQDFYADNIKYGSLRGAENFNGTIECYTYPDEWKACDGRKELVPGVTIAQQNRKAFGLSYRSLIGNDTELLDYGYILHLVYNATASPTEKSRQTVNESPEAQTFSYEFQTTPVPVTRIENAKATSHIEIDSTKVTKNQLDAIEAILYGQAGSVSYSEVAATSSDNPVAEGWYELVGASYVLSSDTVADSEKTYYEKVETGAVDPRLPLPDEVYDILSAINLLSSGPGSLAICFRSGPKSFILHAQNEPILKGV